VKATLYEVGVSPVIIASAQHFERTVYIHSKSGISYIGNSTVTTGAGFPLKSDESIGVIVPINETIYAVDGVGGASVVVLDSSAD
jgi:hypothetical protein